ncbi:hypothetical protein C7999DRAFT_17621 [Corynascus novoguineensis]|uniref:Short-chain dehydrogenase/reductase n=1 Tax=Corynascus novoguineensis TaxID=1126955 RepID=A0AAN7HL96_9PEZI|nr:hypothetical protein C7999DRAFT_17621 [Corynascus novoguineensis]
MVTLEQMRSSNARIPDCLPPGVVAVFAGGTSGIGEATMKQFAKYAVEPRIYFIGRSERAAVRITDELVTINPKGQYHFIQADLSLLHNVDEVCYEIKRHESLINLLFLTPGTMVTGKETPEHLYYPTAVTYYARVRLIVNLLPLLQKAPSLRRVVSVFGGTKEGPVTVGDLQGRSLALPPRSSVAPPKGSHSNGNNPDSKTTSAHLLHLRAHTSSMMTLALESLALEAPDVSFVHSSPGWVRTHLGREVRAASAAAAGSLVKVVLSKVVGPMVAVPLAEAGERQLFLATSARFPPARLGGRRGSGNSSGSAESGGSTESGVAGGTEGVGLREGDGVAVARGSDARIGSGVYSVNFDGEPQGVKAQETVRRLREEDLVRRLWLHTVGEFVRVTGTEFV